jgi:hypothetical protein
MLKYLWEFSSIFKLAKFKILLLKQTLEIINVRLSFAFRPLLSQISTNSNQDEQYSLKYPLLVLLFMV